MRYPITPGNGYECRHNLVVLGRERITSDWDLERASLIGERRFHNTDDAGEI